MLRIALGVSLVVVALNAFAGGYYAVSGAPAVPVEWLEGSPFSSYFIPGLILAIGVGGSSAVAAWAVLRRWRLAPLISLAAGGILLVWIIAQVAIIGYVSWLQPTLGAAAVGILALAPRLERSAPPA